MLLSIEGGMGFFFIIMMTEAVPWITFEQAAKRIRRSRATVFRLVEAGLLQRVYEGLRAKGITLESIAAYESSISYLNDREKGVVDRLPRTAQDRSPLYFAVITGRYPTRGASAARCAGSRHAGAAEFAGAGRGPSGGAGRGS